MIIPTRNTNVKLFYFTNSTKSCGHIFTGGTITTQISSLNHELQKPKDCISNFLYPENGVMKPNYFPSFLDLSS